MKSEKVGGVGLRWCGLTVHTSTSFHDRFIVIDDNVLYLFGASPKDLGKKCFAFTKLNAAEISGLKARICLQRKMAIRPVDFGGEI